MRIPTDKTLREWILELISTGKEYKFYKTDEWYELRRFVMDDHHNECERCAARGIYTRAQTVHHEYELKMYPHLALTRYITEHDGTKREILHPLCNQCHNDVHGRTLKGNQPKPFINEERW